ncbi:unnamed protein product [Cladocopium goreaui]|uniref:Probable periplasmic serine endoprotease DegP-like (Protease Do) n=1 Tax=Cladocopium goreaui TaxID=2562237 RepID=A0A9P1GD67_9DINO|nr:unnamed protein product [Cladocopium goreaui]
MKAERSRRSDWHDQHEGLVWRGHRLCYTCGFHPECFTKPYLKKEGATSIHWIEDEIESCAQAESFGQGAFVEMVLEGSPAEEAKLQENDQIVEVNGQKLCHFDQVQMAVRSTKVGGQLKLKIKRGKETVSTTVPKTRRVFGSFVETP